jgi:hypothetical protein
VDATIYDEPGWRMDERCGGNGGVLFAMAVVYNGPGWRARISDR